MHQRNINRERNQTAYIRARCAQKFAGAQTWKEGVKVAAHFAKPLFNSLLHTPSGLAGVRVVFRREKSPRNFRGGGSDARISANESENPPAARVATIFMGLLVRASDSRSREFASLGAQGLNKS